MGGRALRAPARGGPPALRKDLGLFANLRPAICYPALASSSSLKPELVEGLDILIVRELTGGVYFGEPKEIVTLEAARGGPSTRRSTRRARSTGSPRVAFDLARKRRNKVSSAEKHNVMKSGVLWKEVVTQVHAADYPDVELEHVLADSCAMQLVRRPKQFDVIVTDNLFGDILSDAAAMLTGSLGMLPSASLGAEDASGRRSALYEPVHGSRPTSPARGSRNPLAMIGSLGMALRYSLGLGDVADPVERPWPPCWIRGSGPGTSRPRARMRSARPRWATRFAPPSSRCSADQSPSPPKEPSRSTGPSSFRAPMNGPPR
jgi:3-isopropylmalate dehydrogenase